MSEWFDLTPIVAFSQWDLLAMGLVGLTIGVFSMWWSNKRNSRIIDRRTD